MSLIKQKLNNLIEEVHNLKSYYIEIRWSNNMGSVHVYTKKYKLMETVLNLIKYHSKYYKKEYKVKTIIIRNIKSTNPHIIVNTIK